MNACTSIGGTVPAICQPGMLACQKAASSGAPFKAMAKAITTSSYDGLFLPLAPTPNLQPPDLVFRMRAGRNAGSRLMVTYDDGNLCENPFVNSRVIVSYSCGTVLARNRMQYVFPAVHG